MRNCTCWFNRRGELIYKETECPRHGRKADPEEWRRYDDWRGRLEDRMLDRPR